MHSVLKVLKLLAGTGERMTSPETQAVFHEYPSLFRLVFLVIWYQWSTVVVISQACEYFLAIFLENFQALRNFLNGIW